MHHHVRVIIDSLVREKLPRTYRCTSAETPWAAWSMKPMPEYGIRSMAALGPYRLSSSRSTCSRASSPRPRPRWCTSGSGRTRPCLTTSRTRPAQAIAGRPPRGSWPPRANRFSKWTWWWTSQAWEIQCGEADLFLNHHIPNIYTFGAYDSKPALFPLSSFFLFCFFPLIWRNLRFRFDVYPTWAIERRCRHSGWWLSGRGRRKGVKAIHPQFLFSKGVTNY